MRRFLVEAYTPADAVIEDVERRVRLAAAELTVSGNPVHYVERIFVPEDETCFHLLDAATRSAVHEVVERAGVSPQRVTETATEAEGREKA